MNKLSRYVPRGAHGIALRLEHRIGWRGFSVAGDEMLGTAGNITKLDAAGVGELPRLIDDLDR
jgi:hypothetical protein